MLLRASSRWVKIPRMETAEHLQATHASAWLSSHRKGFYLAPSWTFCFNSCPWPSCSELLYRARLSPCWPLWKYWELLWGPQKPSLLQADQAPPASPHRTTASVTSAELSALSVPSRAGGPKTGALFQTGCHECWGKQSLPSKRFS